MAALDRVFRCRRPSQERPLAAIIAGLWRNGEQGVRFEASDLSTMFQDAAGTLPVYMPGSGQVDPPVGLWLDKSGRGNHAYQATTTSRPTLSARYNLLTKSEDFSNAAWAKSSTATITPSSGAFIFRCGSANTSQLYNATAISGSTTSYTIRIRAKAEYSKFLVIALVDLVGGGYVRVWYDVLAGVVGSTTSGAGVTFVSKSIAPVGDGSFVCELTGLFAAATTIRAAINVSENDAGFTGTAASGLFMYSADIRPGNDGVGLPPYQRVVDANTYDATNFPLYLKFDGVDDWLQTASVDFSATAKVLASAALRKLSDSTAGIVCELSSDVTSNNGAFYLAFPRSATINEPMFGSRGTMVSVAINGSTAYPAPISIVLTGIGDISGDQAVRRVNGVVSVVSVTDQGSGNYGNYPIYIGRRAGASLSFNGRLYGLLIRNAATPGTTIAKVERYLNSKARIY